MSATPAPPPVRPSLGPTSTPAVTASLEPAELAALQEVLAGEHAIVWAYGTLGPRLGGTDEERARSLLATHQVLREVARAQVLAAGGRPVAAEAAYTLPLQPADPATAAQLAQLVEERLAEVYADLVAAAVDQQLRAQGVGGVVDATLRAASWGMTETAFPGLPER